MPKRPREPLRVPYQPPTGLLSERPHASTVPSAAAFSSSAAPSGTQSPCSFSQVCRSSIARAWYVSFVEPTWQTRIGGAAASSRYIVYSELPGGVVSRHGSSLVPSLMREAYSRSELD